MSSEYTSTPLARLLRRRAGFRARPMDRSRINAAVNVLTHSRAEDEKPWRWLPAVLALAFAVRAAVSLAGDFVLHPDEIMQYLEPAHRLAFGNGIVYWEYFYGARSWLIPGAVAAFLKLCAAVGLDQPWWYVNAVKLLLCALSLVIPAAMYFFARRHFGEVVARAALLTGALWYELVGFAHKPMTEFVATAPLMGLLALCVRTDVRGARIAWHAAALAVLVAAVRVQYAPVALLLLGILFFRTDRRLLLFVAAALLLLAVGMFDALSWGGGLFHSYLVNVRFNLALGTLRSGESLPHQFLWWLTLASGGLSVVTLVLAMVNSPRRYGLLVVVVALILVSHSLQSHKEYRFIFAVAPLWLLIGTDIAVRAAAWASARTGRVSASRWIVAAAGGVLATVSVAGVLNALPLQQQVYRAWSGETGIVGFVRQYDPVFAAYRYLARAPGVTAVWQLDRIHVNLPGYYYLHRDIPFYDVEMGRDAQSSLVAPLSFVSHLVSADPELEVPGYVLERDFGGFRVLRRDVAVAPARRWRRHTPILIHPVAERVMRQIDADAPAPPAQAGVSFADPR